uniref:Uncharacterized protein n=1 Tax=Heterorhabditis bacteriophora TaxID=37862 RepID=A0A1I7WL08_HETBA
MRQNVFFVSLEHLQESRYVRMIAIKFSIDMILSRIGSLTAAPTVHPEPYRCKMPPA